MTTVERAQNDPMVGVPEHLQDGLRRYLLHGIQPGHFLTAVLENNLFEAMARADLVSRAGLFGLVSHLYNEAPRGCYGSREIVQAWCKHRGLTGLTVGVLP